MLLSAGTATFDVDGVVFDKDGTLISLESYWLAPSRLWIAVAAGGSTDLERTLDRTLGLASGGERLVPDGPLATATLDDLVELTARVLEAVGVESAVATALEARDRAVALSATLTPTPIGDVVGTFQRLAAAGLHLAIATTDDAAPTIVALHVLGIENLVDVVVAADGDVQPKPHPEVLGSIGRTFGITPDRLLMVGDSQRDADTARAGGAAGFVLVSQEQLPRITTDAMIASVEDLRFPAS
ncbi:MAG: HAD family hydrolase [Acidimicrobiia bacterium]